MNKSILPIIVIAVIAAGIGAYFVFQKPAFPQLQTGKCGDGICDEKEKVNPNLCPKDCLEEVPFITHADETRGQVSTFLMIHFEVGAAESFPWYAEIVKGSDTGNLKYQEALWPTAIEIVNLANKYNAKLTLGFTPQWAEYILMDEKKINMIREWQKQGHEIAYQHHGIDHPDWDGYSNRSEAKSKKGYRGTAAEGFEFLKKLAYPKNVIVGTITDTAIDLPEGIKILTYGGGKYGSGHLADAVTKPETRIKGSKETIWVGHGFLESFFHNDKKTNDLLAELKEKYEAAPPDKVLGVVTHCHDFYRYPDALKEWFKFLQSKGQPVQTVGQIVK